jgi:hypothetical protein
MSDLNGELITPSKLFLGPAVENTGLDFAIQMHIPGGQEINFSLAHQAAIQIALTKGCANRNNIFPDQNLSVNGLPLIGYFEHFIDAERINSINLANTLLLPTGLLELQFLYDLSESEYQTRAASIAKAMVDLIQQSGGRVWMDSITKPGTFIPATDYPKAVLLMSQMLNWQPAHYFLEQ